MPSGSPIDAPATASWPSSMPRPCSALSSNKGVAPRRALALGVHRVGRRRRGTAPDGGAARRVGDGHALAEQLGDQAGVGGLGAAGAGAGELEQGLFELAALHLACGELGLVGRPGSRSNRTPPAESSVSAMGFMVSDPVGHWMTHRPQPMQSSGETESACTACLAPPCPSHREHAWSEPGPPPAPRRSARRDGWWRAGTRTSTGCTGCRCPASHRAPSRRRRASRKRRRQRNWPSSWSMNTDTGRLSPSMRPTGSMISVTSFTSSGRPSMRSDRAGPRPSSSFGHRHLDEGRGARIDCAMVHVHDVWPFLR